MKHYSKTEVQDLEDMEHSLIDYSKEVKYKYAEVTQENIPAVGGGPSLFPLPTGLFPGGGLQEGVYILRP